MLSSSSLSPSSERPRALYASAHFGSTHSKLPSASHTAFTSPQRLSSRTLASQPCALGGRLSSSDRT